MKPIQPLMWKPGVGMSTPVMVVNPGQGGRGKKKGKKATMQDAQAGGFAIAPILAAATAIHTGLSKYQPFSKVKKALEDNVGEKGKSNIAYKIGHKVASVGSSLGYGAPKKKKRSRKHK